MASRAFQISALLLAFLGLLLVLGTTVSSNWKICITVTTFTWFYEGLWMHCTTTSMSVVQCEKFHSFLYLHTYIQACRALMILSLVLGVSGTLLALLGLRCTQLGTATETKKAKIAMIGGMMFILSGLSSMVAVSWYAARVMAEFFDSLYGGTKYELGSALYLGWAGSTLSILGGIFLTCASCKGKPKAQKHDYTAAQSTSEPCIYIKKSESVIPAKDYV
ncbi:claudin-15-like isoform X1 [Varanus komodoensis]|uniref:Claudin n=1 Tax=Varanus komodoensis TaxID=61221 RepID=A0A8D2IL76_VARKO|nr:claudin-15-like isoform X1 [Varanus komodoensis]XP_044292008.1 claudin-15-like isoform X1 [Varanus komodoensis]